MKKLSALLIIAVLMLTCLFSSCDLLPSFGNVTNNVPEGSTAESATNSNTETTTPSDDPSGTPELSKNDFLSALEKWDAYLPFSNKECSTKTTETMKTLDGKEVYKGESLMEMDFNVIKVYDGIENFTIYFAKEGDKYYEITQHPSTGDWKKEEFVFSNGCLAYMMSLAGNAKAMRQELLAYEFSYEDGFVTFRHPDHPEAYIRITIQDGMITKYESYSLVENEGSQFHYTRTIDFIYGDVTILVPSVS